MKSSILLVVFAAAASLSSSGAPPDEIPPASELGRAFVTIPYSELRALWEAGQRRSEPPKPEAEAAPVPFVVHRADYHLAIGDQSSALDVDYEVETLTKGWQSIPLMGGEVSLEKATAGECSVIWKDGYTLLANQPGKTPVALQLSVAGGKKFVSPGVLKFRVGSAAVNRLAISGIGEGLEARVNGRPASEIKDGVALFHLPSEAGELRVELDAPKVEAPPKPPRPSQWSSETQVLARYGEGRLLFQARIFVHADDGSGSEMAFALPSNATAVTIMGNDVDEWTSTRSEDGRERIFQVRWKTPDILVREIALVYEAAQSPLSERWTLSAPSVVGDKGAQHLFAIISAEGLELKGDGVQEGVAKQRLPHWLREAIGGEPFVTADGGVELALHARWLPTLAIAEAIVSDAKGELQVVTDGSMQTSITYTIRHSASLAWKVELPSSVELLSCVVNGHPMRPVLREAGALELGLPGPATDKDLTTVTLVYAAKIKALDPVSGQLSLEMPLTPLFTEHFEWLVTIPDPFEIAALDGNATAAEARTAGAPSAASRNVIKLRKDFCRGERPAISLFYQRHNLEK
jgi:hypothetical protein